MRNRHIISYRAARQRRHEDRSARKQPASRLRFPAAVALVAVLAFTAPFAIREGHRHLSGPSVAEAASVPLPVCSGGNRAERKLTCIVDGDTGWEHGIKWRLLAIDTPEISKPECATERRIGLAARDRLRAMMGAGYEIEWSGDKGRYERDLVRIRLSDGRDAGEALIAEGLAQPWPNEGNVWCVR